MAQQDFVVIIFNLLKFKQIKLQEYYSQMFQMNLTTFLSFVSTFPIICLMKSRLTFGVCHKCVFQSQLFPFSENCINLDFIRTLWPAQLPAWHLKLNELCLIVKQLCDICQTHRQKDSSPVTTHTVSSRCLPQFTVHSRLNSSDSLMRLNFLHHNNPLMR